MRKPLPTLAASAVILAACSAGGTDTMAELMHDAGAMLEDAGRAMMGVASTIDAAGPADARAQAKELDAACSLSTVATTGPVVQTHYFAQFDVADVAKVARVLICDPAGNPNAAYCPSGATTCTGFTIPTPQCSTSLGFSSGGGKFYVPCGVVSGGVDTHYRKARIVVE
jgi:hypothetical protein